MYRVMVGRCWQCGDSHHGAELHADFTGQLPSARGAGGGRSAARAPVEGQ